MKKVFLVLVILLLLGCIKNEDMENDGLPDEIEEKGWSISVLYAGERASTRYNVTSDPRKVDTDGDGLTDFEESPYSGNLFPTDPRKVDTDGDGLTDYEELKIFETNPINWKDDIDGDNVWWNSDYEEISFYRKIGISDEKIREFIRNPDVDGDGVFDGGDIDPLRDLRVDIVIKWIKIISDMGDKDSAIEMVINISSGLNSTQNDEIIVLPGENFTSNQTFHLDLDDRGEPGNGTSPIWIILYDMDTKLAERNYNDYIWEYDIIRIYGNSSFYKNLKIPDDCGEYYINGADGEMCFEIIDASIGV
ncbi:MAG: hypothetical protein H5T44_05715 [Thermoplasmatales archaeon]|nr:hypothetical protein [Thermoplasmatales archaeon]